MSPRYLLVVGARQSPKLQRDLGRLPGLKIQLSTDQLAILTDESCPCLGVGGRSCVLGALFDRNGPARVKSSISSTEAASIVDSEGQALLHKFWGGYVAAIDGPRGVRILRDPSGDFPCYFTRFEELTAVASDAELLVQSGLSGISVDLEEIGRQLFRAFVPVPSTALQGVRELLAGFALRLPSIGMEQEQCWSPWDHARPADRERQSVAERLSRTIHHSVHAIGSRHQRLLLSLSGGLDSSIVGACLATAGLDTVCLTMFSEDAAGDEREFARAVCDRTGLPLIERPYRFGDVDLHTPIAPNLPRPRDRLQALAFERVHYSVAEEVGATAFITGNGGDHVFAYSQSASAVADRYLIHGLGRGTFSSLADVCRQTGCSLVDALRQAWRLARAPPGYRVRPNPLFLAADFARELGPRDWHHPWLEAPPGALPGKAAHVATILRVQPNLEPSLGDRFPVLNPLVSQPVVEQCLGIPSWEWREGGRDRSLVRAAFADQLPPTILERRVKGTPGRFASRLLDHFRGAIRERLLGGRLASAGIIDARALETALAGERPVADLDRVRILELVNAETWIDHWGRRARSAGPPAVRSDGRGLPVPSDDPIP